MRIKIKNLRLRTVIGVFDWERKEPQDIVLNIEIEFDGSAAAASDDLNDTVDYKSHKKRIMHLVESAETLLLERLADQIHKLILEDEKVTWASVEIDKPHALRFADSVSVTAEGGRDA